MAIIEFSEEVFEDFARFRDHLDSHDVARPEAARRIRGIVRAIELLAQNPYLGRPAGRGARELVIGRKNRSYVVLYRYVPELDLVLIIAARHHAEGGYKR